jgi:hypothetical protein
MCEVQEIEYYGYFPNMYEITKLMFEYGVDDNK